MMPSDIQVLIITDKDHEHLFKNLFPTKTIIDARDIGKVVQMIHDGNPQLIIVTINGNMKQIEKLYKHLKSDEHLKAIPLILISDSDPTTNQIPKSIQTGVEAIVSSEDLSSPTNLIHILSKYFFQIQSLQRSTAIFSEFFTQSPVYVFIKRVTATENVLLYGSKNLLAFNDLPGTQISGISIHELADPENAKIIMEAEWDMVKNNEIRTEEKFYKGRYYTSIKFPLFYNEETLLGGFVIDVTSQKQIEESLRTSEEHFRSIVDHSDAGYFFIDDEGIIQDVNQAWIKLYKYNTPEEIIGQHFTVIQKIEDVEAAQVFVNGIINNDPNYVKGEFSRQCKDGSIGYHTYSARPVIKDNKVIGIEGFIIDTTERRMAVEALRRSEERYHLIDEASEDMIYSYDLDKRFTHANRHLCKILQLTPEQIIGKNHEELGFRADLIDEWAELYQRVLDTDATVFDESIILLPDGTKRHVDVKLSPMHDSEGKIIGIAGISRDIHEQKLAEVKIKEQMAELKSWHNVTMGREERVLDLKREINQLLEEAGKPHKYKSVGKLDENK